MNRFLISILLIPLSLMISCKGKQQQAEQPGKGQRSRNQLAVDAIIVKPSVLVNQINVSGSILALEEVTLVSEMSGRIVQLNLPEGKKVKKGDLLVQIFNDDMQATLKKLQAQLENQEKILQRQTELIKVNGVSQADFDQSNLLVRTLKADIEVQQSLIRKSQILAPFDGTIGLRYVSLGAMVSPSTLIATIRMEDKLKMDFSVPEKYSSKVKTGLKVTFTLSGNSGKQFDAIVMATEGGIDATTRNIKVRAMINSNDSELIPGIFTNVLLSMGENNQALMIPTQAIIPQERNKSVIVSKKGKAHFVQVTTGIRKESMVEITNGVNPGDTIITNGILFLKEGVKLSFANIIK